MKRYRLVLCAYLALLIVTPVIADNPGAAGVGGVVGRWEGELRDSGNHLILGFEFKEADGKLEASLYCNDWGLESIPVGEAKVNGEAIESLLFKGTVQKDGAMAGTLDFGPFGVPGLELPLVLKKAAAGQSPAPPTPAGKTAQAAWSFSTGGEIYSSPTVSGGNVFFGSDDGKFYAVNAKTGKLRWSFETRDAVRSRPAVSSGTVFLVSDDGYLYALDSSSGELRWKFDTKTSIVPHSRLGAGDERWDYLQSSPAVAGGLVYVGSGNSNLYAVDAATGRQKWFYTAGDTIRSSPIVASGTVYFGCWDNSLYALDAATGAEKWRFDTRGVIQASPTLVGDTLLVGSRYPYVFALDAASGKERWRFNYFGSWVESTAAADQGTVFVGSSDYGHLFSIDLKTGQRKWAFKTGGYAWSSPAISSNLVLIGSARNAKRHRQGADLYAVDSATGKEVWRFKTENKKNAFLEGVVSSPAVAEGMVYIGSLDGKLYAVPIGG